VLVAPDEPLRELGDGDRLITLGVELARQAEVRVSGRGRETLVVAGRIVPGRSVIGAAWIDDNAPSPGRVSEESLRARPSSTISRPSWLPP